MRISALGLVFLAAVACDRAPDPSGQWTALDHDKEPAAQQGQQTAPTGSNRLSPQQQVVEAAWMSTCASCHGPIGKGDGPNGLLVKAPDLTREDWQATVKDEEIGARIRAGKGLMPPNPDMTETTLRGLIQRIRALRGQ
jgi:cytochrome c553